MRKTIGVVAGVLAAAGLAGGPAAADEVVGAIWKFERQDRNIKWVFRAGPKGVVWTVPKAGLPEKMGTWTGNPGRSVVTIDQGGRFGNKRSITIVQTGKNPPKWQGEVEILEGVDRGKKFPVEVTLVKD